LEVAEETVTLAPAALSVPVKLLLCPTTTLPKFRVVVATVNCPPEPPDVPSADNDTLRIGFEAFEATEMVPLALPLDLGAKTTPNVTLCPPVKFNGRFKLLRLNPEPVMLA